MSDTPLTDAELKRIGCPPTEEGVSGHFARALERENQALREAIDEAVSNLAEQAPHSAEALLRAAQKKYTK